MADGACPVAAGTVQFRAAAPTTSRRSPTPKRCSTMNRWLHRLTLVTLASATCLLMSATPGAQDKERQDKNEKADSKRPRLTLKAQPVIAMSPARIVLTAELVGGANDY